MKTQRRHELKTNDLSAFLADANEWVKQHASSVGLVVVVVLAVFIAITFTRRSRASSTDAAWDTMRKLSFTVEEAQASFDTLDRLIQEAKDPNFKMTALLNKGKSALMLATLRPEGFHPEFLDRAEEAYKTLMEAYPQRMPVVATALRGLASVEENRFVTDGDVKHRDKAKAYLQKLQNDPQFKGTPFQTRAAKALQMLDETFQVITLAEPLPLPPAPPPPPVSVTSELQGVTVQSRAAALAKQAASEAGAQKPNNVQTQQTGSQKTDAAAPPESSDHASGEGPPESKKASHDDSASGQDQKEPPSESEGDPDGQ